MTEEELIEGVKIVMIDDLINELSKFREKHGNLPVYHYNDAMHEEISFFSIEPETDDEEELNKSLPRRLLIS